MIIKSVNLQLKLAGQRAELDAAMARVLDSGWFILGPEVKAFEAEFAAFVGVAHGVGVASGTDALHLALRACGIGPGDEVVTTAHTAVATVAAIEHAGAQAVLADIDPVTYTLDPASVAGVLGPRVKAIIPVHLYGQPADLEALLSLARDHGLKLIEDCSQAHGATYRGRRVGSFGHAGCFSFYPTKNLGGYGDGGMVVAGDAEVAARLRLLREYGWAERYVSHVSGFNSRLDELQAALLRVGLQHLDAENGMREELARRYTAGLADAAPGLPRVRPGSTSVHHQYVVRSPRRDELRAHLKAGGIDSLIHYPVPVHLQPAYRDRLRGADRLPHTEAAAREVLSLPMYPGLTAGDIDAICARIKAW